MKKVLFVGQSPETVDYPVPALPPGFHAEKILAGIVSRSMMRLQRDYAARFGKRCFPHLHLLFASVLVLTCLPQSVLAKVSSSITNVVPIKIDDGVNRVANFSKDGRDAVIIKAWRENGNAHSYFLYVVMLAGSKVVGIDMKDKLVDDLRDDPHTREDYVRTIRFARGSVNGTSETLLIIAQRDIAFGEEIPAPAHTVIETYKLSPKADDGFGTPDQFVLVDERTTRSKYCNSELALSQALHVQLPDDYKGLNRRDGCP